MLKIAVYPGPERPREQRVFVLDQPDLTIATHAAADIPLQPRGDSRYYCAFVSRGQDGPNVVRSSHSSPFTVAGVEIAPNLSVRVSKSDAIRLGEYRVYVRETIGPLEESDDERATAAFVHDLRRGRADDPLRLVFADWLDEHGQRDRAAYLRAQYTFANLGPDAGELVTSSVAAKLRRLAKVVDPKFRALTSVQVIENCKVAFDVVCPRRWADLYRTGSEDVRTCSTCNKNVYYCNSIEEAQLHASSGDCVALDPQVARGPNDLTVTEPTDYRMGGPTDADIDELFDD